MADYPALPLWTDAYLADCGHLDDAEHGRYLLILMAMWRAPGQRLPNDDEWLARKFKRSVERVKSELRPLIAEFCFSDGNWIKQKRLEKEFKYVKKQADQRSVAAKARWNKEKKNAGAHTDAPSARNAPTPTPTPTPQQGSASHSRDLLGNLAPAEPAIAERAVAMWNELAASISLPKVQRLTETRARSLKARLKECGGLDGWAVALEKVASTPFLRGENQTGWHADFDFLMQQKSFTKLMEGGYSAGPARRGGKSPLMEAIGRMANGE
jgi:uncharacterized protein YdaU (DUF1376 family)